MASPDASTRRRLPSPFWACRMSRRDGSTTAEPLAWARSTSISVSWWRRAVAAAGESASAMREGRA